MYEPKIKSIRKHQVPDWFHDAKFGIFIHWSLSSVPAFAATGQGDLSDIQEKQGPGAQFANNPYAEWYLNSLRLEGTPTQKYHRKMYGDDFLYDDFVPMFNKEIKKWDPKEWADTFKKAGAKYVVLVTKHHDGFLLWPSKYPNPNKKDYHATRDVVGELTKAVKDKGLKMGFYYSGALDWSFNENPIISIVSLLDNGPTDPEYAEYVDNHWRELIDKYEPIILWNDIGYPPKGKLYELFAYFYNRFPDGVVNDRWMRIPKFARTILKFKPITLLVEWIVKKMTSKEGAAMPEPKFCDFQTPEYARFNETREKKWETTRGIGHSFGYNQFEPEDQYLTLEELIHMFVDVVSKNGNLLLNVGPMTDGRIPEIQKKLILDFGQWLEVNGEAIYGTRPWIRAEGKALNDVGVRYTQKKDALYAIVLGKSKGKVISINNLVVEEKSTIKILGIDGDLKWEQQGDILKISVTAKLPDAHAFSLKISPKPNI